MFNIARVLKDAPRGTKLYSPLCGECWLVEVSKDGEFIKVRDYDVVNTITLNKFGKSSWRDSEVLLFPSATQRDWSKFLLEPIKFPKTYSECCVVLELDLDSLLSISATYGFLPYRDRLYALLVLLVCRDAWWKMDGDWNPDWEDDEYKFSVFYSDNQATRVKTKTNRILAFRTEEIRDKFIETFSTEIEQCKELL